MSERWPIVPWTHNGKRRFKVEDDQGYGFSFDSYAEADAFRQMSGVYVRTMKERIKPMVQRFKEEVFS